MPPRSARHASNLSGSNNTSAQFASSRKERRAGPASATTQAIKESPRGRIVPIEDEIGDDEGERERASPSKYPTPLPEFEPESPPRTVALEAPESPALFKSPQLLVHESFSNTPARSVNQGAVHTAPQILHDSQGHVRTPIVIGYRFVFSFHYRNPPITKSFSSSSNPSPPLMPNLPSSISSLSSALRSYIPLPTPSSTASRPQPVPRSMRRASTAAYASPQTRRFSVDDGDLDNDILVAPPRFGASPQSTLTRNAGSGVTQALNRRSVDERDRPAMERNTLAEPERILSARWDELSGR